MSRRRFDPATARTRATSRLSDAEVASDSVAGSADELPGTHLRDTNTEANGGSDLRDTNAKTVLPHDGTTLRDTKIEAAVVLPSYRHPSDLPDPRYNLDAHSLALVEFRARGRHTGVDYVRLSELHDSPHQVRVDYGDIDTLATQIASVGLTDPPAVRWVSIGGWKRLVLTDGHRRTRAYRVLVRRAQDEDVRRGREPGVYDPRIPVRVTQVDDAGAALATYTSNGGKKLEALEEARQIAVIASEMGRQRPILAGGGDPLCGLERSVSNAVGKSPSTVSERLLVARQITNERLTRAGAGADAKANPGTSTVDPQVALANHVLDVAVVKGLSHQVLYEAAMAYERSEQEGDSTLTRMVARVRAVGLAKAKRAEEAAATASAKADARRRRELDLERYREACDETNEYNLEAARRGRPLRAMPEPPTSTPEGKRLAADRERQAVAERRDATLRRAYIQARNAALSVRARKAIGRHTPEEAVEAFDRAAPQLIALAERTPLCAIHVRVPDGGDVLVVPALAERATAHQVVATLERLESVIYAYARRSADVGSEDVTAQIARRLAELAASLHCARGSGAVPEA